MKYRIKKVTYKSGRMTWTPQHRFLGVWCRFKLYGPRDEYQIVYFEELEECLLFLEKHKFEILDSKAVKTHYIGC